MLRKYATGEFFSSNDPLHPMNEILAPLLPDKPSLFHFDGAALYNSEGISIMTPLDNGQVLPISDQTLSQLHALCFQNILDISNDMLKVVKSDYFEGFYDEDWPMSILVEGKTPQEHAKETLTLFTEVMRYTGESSPEVGWELNEEESPQEKVSFFPPPRLARILILFSLFPFSPSFSSRLCLAGKISKICLF